MAEVCNLEFKEASHSEDTVTANSMMIKVVQVRPSRPGLVCKFKSTVQGSLIQAAPAALTWAPSAKCV